MHSGGHPFKRGVVFVRDNPQLLYTIFLLVALPLAFVISSEQFLSAAQQNQEQEEQARVASLHDALVDIVRDTINDPGTLAVHLDRVTARDSEITGLEVLKKESPASALVVGASPQARAGDLGTQVHIGASPAEQDFEYGIAQGNPGETYVFTRQEGGVRILHGVQAVADEGGTVVGFIVSDTSMGRIDLLAKQNINRAFIVLAFVILLMFVLLFRHARIVDYTVLYRKLKGVDQMKDDFISMAAHELRTPLSVVRGYASMLAESHTLAPEDHTQAEHITRSATQLNSLVDDLLDVMRIEQGRMEFAHTAVDVSAAAREVAGMLAVNAKEKNIALSLEAAAGVRAMLDPDRFRQVLLNIAGNAVKYTAEGSVTVRVAAEGAHAVVRVSDTGIGISAEDQKNLFGKFYRVKSEETKNIRGTGLGLWITKQMVEKMGGTIGIESIKGRGTDVTLSFPLVG